MGASIDTSLLPKWAVKMSILEAAYNTSIIDGNVNSQVKYALKAIEYTYSLDGKVMWENENVLPLTTTKIFIAKPSLVKAKRTKLAKAIRVRKAQHEE